MDGAVLFSRHCSAAVSSRYRDPSSPPGEAALEPMHFALERDWTERVGVGWSQIVVHHGRGGGGRRLWK